MKGVIPIAKTAAHLTLDELAVYKRHALAHVAREHRSIELRRQRAFELVRQAADLLRYQFGATRVVVFGSLLDPDRFTAHSDVDIAAWGIPTDETFRAIGEVLDLGHSHGFELNLVDVNACHAALRESICATGVEV